MVEIVQKVCEEETKKAMANKVIVMLQESNVDKKEGFPSGQ